MGVCEFIRIDLILINLIFLTMAVDSSNKHIFLSVLVKSSRDYDEMTASRKIWIHESKKAFRLAPCDNRKLTR